MKRLIEFPLLRKIKIIQSLVTEKESLSEKEIALLNACSISTAKNDIEDIDKEYKEIFGVEVKNGILKFSNLSIPESNRVVRSLFSESLNIQLLLVVFDDPYQDRRHYCKATAISEASFYRALKNINQVIQDYGFSIQFQEGGYFLQAQNEKELRAFIVSLYLETKTMDQCFVRIPFDDLKALVSQYFLTDFSLNCDIYASYFSYYACVSLIRKSQGFILQDKSSDQRQPSYQILKKYFPTLNENHLSSIRQGVFQARTFWVDEKEKDETIETFRNFIQDFFSINKLTYDESLFQEILRVIILTYGGFELFPNKYKIVFNRVDHFIDSFKNNRPQRYQSFHRLFDKVNQSLKDPKPHLADQLLFLIAILAPDFYSKKTQAKIRIYSDLGLEHKNFYRAIFQDYFTDILVLDAENNESPDFIVSNYFLESAETPIFFIKDYPLRQDLRELHEEMFGRLTPPLALNQAHGGFFA